MLEGEPITRNPKAVTFHHTEWAQSGEEGYTFPIQVKHSGKNGIVDKQCTVGKPCQALGSGQGDVCHHRHHSGKNHSHLKEEESIKG